ncbi:MAG: hypothetical protein C0510_06775 [Erythrobacter sp.]|nr:hypothetical protein [Erythrobacter sp.]
MDDTATHILNWCENSAPHYRRLNRLIPGNYTTAREHAYEAFKLASDVAALMVRAGDLSRMKLDAADILRAAALIIEREPVA